MAYASLALDELLELLGAATPAPASGTAAALTGALAAALAELAAGVSGKPGAVEEARKLRASLAALADDDAEAYTAYLAERTPEARDRTIDIPLAIAEVALEVAELGGRVAREGKPSVAGDALAATDIASGAARAAVRLVELNLAGTDDPRRDHAAELARQAGTWIPRMGPL
jgi:formiminotetrahydrofolate cyclodeaminase